MTQLKKKRIRGVVLTDVGLKKLQAARLESESKSNYGERYTYEKISELTNLDINTVKRVLAKKEPVDKRSLEKFLLAFKVKLTPENYSKPTPKKLQNWGEAVTIDHFFGRTQELKTLEEWLIEKRCRLVALLGMGGIGKTTLSIKIAQQVQDSFECIVWKSLRDAPPAEEVVSNLIEFLSTGKEIGASLPLSFGDKVTLLLKYLSSLRCLIVLDNVESLLDSGSRAGTYRQGYAEYSELLQRIGATKHASSVIITSREKPGELAALEGTKLLVRSLQLEGLKEEGAKIFQLKGLTAPGSELQELGDRYSGNPLALKVVATTVQDLFEGDISEFLAQENAVFGDIRDILDQQFSRLSSLEQEIMYWLAIAREPVSLANLKEDFVLPITKIKLLESLESLSRRSLIENSASRFTQQSVVMEYVTSNLIETVCQEILAQKPIILRDHALIKATAKDYIRENQVRLILQPLINELLRTLKSQRDLEACLMEILVTMQQEFQLEKWYVAGNLINLLCQLETDLTGYDFSNLCVWQADLRQAQLYQVNFQNSDLSKSVFAENFGGIWSVVFSPDGQYLAAGDTKGKILLRRVADGQPVRSFEGHTAWVVSLAFSPDGNTLASSSCDCTAKLWDVATGQCLHSLAEHEQEVWSVAFSPDGETLATGCDDSTIRRWNVRTGECFQVYSGHQSEVLSIVFSLDGKTLFSASQDKTIRFWDVATGECQQILTGHDDGIRSLSISPNGKILASSSNDRTIRLWNIKTGKCLRVFRGHSNVVLSVTFNPQGDLIASSSIDQEVKLWGVETGECLKVFQGHTSIINAIDFNPQGNILASGSNDQSIKLWNADTYECLKTIQGCSNQTLSTAFCLNGKTLISAGYERKIRLWDMDTGKVLKVLYGHNDWIFSVAYSLENSLIASGSGDKTVKLWDINTGKEIKTLLGHKAVVRSVKFGLNGQILASGSEDRTIKLWNVHTGKTTKNLDEHQAEVWTVAFSPDSKILASASFDKTIKLWNTKTGECQKTLYGHDSWVWSVDFSPDNKTLVSTSADQTIRFWDINTGCCEKILDKDVGNSQLIAFSNDGLTIANCNHKHDIQLRRVDTGKCFKILKGHTALIHSISFSPDDQILVSSSEDESMKIWNAKNGRCLRSLKLKHPYENMNLKSVSGLTKIVVETLKNLGAYN